MTNATAAHPFRDPGMFPGIRSRNYGFEPTAEEMEKALEAARYEKSVHMTGYVVRTFDLSDSGQVAEYQKERVKLYRKAKSGEVVVHQLEHQHANDGDKVKWFVHMEYSTYRFDKKDRLVGADEKQPEQPMEIHDE